MRPILPLALSALLPLVAGPLAGGELATRVVMQEKSAATFYVPASIAGLGAAELMVDTGSGYMTINEATLAVLQRTGHARYVKQLQGILADGSELIVPVYAISGIAIGNSCWLENVEAAVFPGKARQILGLSALRRAAPFTFSVDPPALTLSNCIPPPATASIGAGPALTVVD
jgi:predicted aspartyl protease